jgi:hypothetical protein
MVTVALKDGSRITGCLTSYRHDSVTVYAGGYPRTFARADVSAVTA